MKEKRSNIDAYNEEAKFNKMAFDDILGDPFAIDREGNNEPRLGNYVKLAGRSVSIQAMSYDDLGKSTRSPGQPNVQDFICDVDRIISIELANEPETMVKLKETWIYESTETAFTPRERMLLEQRLGKLFRGHRLSPVTKYFTVIRKGHQTVERK